MKPTKTLILLILVASMMISLPKLGGTFHTRHCKD